jgi:hypothetical protein
MLGFPVRGPAGQLVSKGSQYTTMPELGPPAGSSM